MLLNPSVRLLVAAANPETRITLFDNVIGNAVALSDHLVSNDVLTSAAVYQHRILFEGGQWNEKLGIVGLSDEHTRHLDRRAIINVGSTVNAGEILVGAYRHTTVGLTPEEKLLHVMFGKLEDLPTVDHSFRCDFADSGVVSNVALLAQVRGRCNECGDVPLDSSETCPFCAKPTHSSTHDDLPRGKRFCVIVEILIRREVRVGDILEDDDGNKLTVACLVPASEMPTFKTKRVDVWTHWNSSVAASLTQEKPVRHASLKRQPASTRLSRFAHLELRKVTLRLEEKLQARRTGKYNLITQLPFCGDSGFSGQRVDSETARTLIQAGYPANVMEIFTIKSDAIEGRVLAVESLVAGKSVAGGLPATLDRLQVMLNGLRLRLVFLDRYRQETEPNPRAVAYQIKDAFNQESDAWSFGEVKKTETINHRTYRPEEGGLFCERIFGPEKDWECSCGKFRGTKHERTTCDRCGVMVAHSRVRRQRFGHIELAAPVVHFWFFRASNALQDLLGMDAASLEKVIYFQDYLVVDSAGTPLRDGQLLTEDEYNKARAAYGDGIEVWMGAQAILRLLQRRNIGLEKSLIVKRIPVIPPDFRPLILLDSGKFHSSDLNQHYRRIINRNNRVKKLVDLKAPEVILRHEKRMLQQSVDALFYNNRCNRPVLWNNNRSLKCLASHLSDVISELFDKPTEYSARAMPIPDAAQTPGTIGIPEFIAFELFHPIIVGGLIRSGTSDSIKSARELIETEKQSPSVRSALRDALCSRPLLVIGNSLKIRSLQPVLCKSEAVRLCPEDANSLDLKFDGVQVSLYMPLSSDAINELQGKSTIVGSASTLDKLTPERIATAATTNAATYLEPLDQIALGIFPLPSYSDPSG